MRQTSLEGTGLLTGGSSRSRCSQGGSREHDSKPPPPGAHLFVGKNWGAEMAHASCRHTAAGEARGGGCSITPPVPAQGAHDRKRGSVPPTREGVSRWSRSPSCHLHLAQPPMGRQMAPDQAEPSAAEPGASYLRECENGRALRGGRRREEETHSVRREAVPTPPSTRAPRGHLPGAMPPGRAGRGPGLTCARPCLVAREKPREKARG